MEKTKSTMSMTGGRILRVLLAVILAVGLMPSLSCMQVGKAYADDAAVNALVYTTGDGASSISVAPGESFTLKIAVTTTVETMCVSQTLRYAAAGGSAQQIGASSSFTCTSYDSSPKGYYVAPQTGAATQYGNIEMALNEAYSGNVPAGTYIFTETIKVNESATPGDYTIESLCYPALGGYPLGITPSWANTYATSMQKLNVTVKGVELDKTSVEMDQGADVQLTASSVPEGEITFASSDASVATVDSTGKIHGVDGGTCTITATATDTGLSATCAVRVFDADYPIVAPTSDSPVTISQAGTYKVAYGSTGTIAIDISGDDKSVTLVGNGLDYGYKNLNITVADGCKLTVRDLCVTCDTDAPNIVDFAGTGAFNIEGTNLFDRADGYGSNALIHVGPSANVTFGGTGMFFAYKHSAGAVIGSNAEEANGVITFNSGTWFMKGSKTGPLIGNDALTDDVKCGSITINGGAFYLKSVASAIIGPSRLGVCIPNVYINGGQLQFFVDWLGAAIGGNVGGSKVEGAAINGNCYITGGSIEGILSPNAAQAYGSTSTAGSLWWGAAASNVKTASVVFPGVFTANMMDASGETVYMARIDMAKYKGTDVTVKVDGETAYTGAATYAYATSEQKNPTDTSKAIVETTQQTVANWGFNDDSFKLGARTGTYPNQNGSVLAGDTGLYLWMTAGNHTITIGDDTYACAWNASTQEFTVAECVASISCASENVTVGSTIQVPITLQGTNVAAAEGTFEYDKDVLSLVSITAAEGVLSGTDFSFQSGNDKFSFYQNETDLTKGAVVAIATFECKAASDSTSIKLTSVVGGSSVQTAEINCAVNPDTVEMPILADGITVGDVNNSGKINIVDAQVAYDLGAGKYGTDWAAAIPEGWTKASVFYAADVNEDDAVDSSDAQAIQYYVHNGEFGTWE